MKIKFELESKDANYILAVLSKQPFDQVSILIADLMRQAQLRGSSEQTAST